MPHPCLEISVPPRTCKKQPALLSNGFSSLSNQFFPNSSPSQTDALMTSPSSSSLRFALDVESQKWSLEWDVFNLHGLSHSSGLELFWSNSQGQTSIMWNIPSSCRISGVVSNFKVAKTLNFGLCLSCKQNGGRFRDSLKYSKCLGKEEKFHNQSELQLPDTSQDIYSWQNVGHMRT